MDASIFSAPTVSRRSSSRVLPFDDQADEDPSDIDVSIFPPSKKDKGKARAVEPSGPKVKLPAKAPKKRGPYKKKTNNLKLNLASSRPSSLKESISAIMGSDEEGVVIPGQRKRSRPQRLIESDDEPIQQFEPEPEEEELPYGGILDENQAAPGDRKPVEEDKRRFNTAKMRADASSSLVLFPARH